MSRATVTWRTAKQPSPKNTSIHPIQSGPKDHGQGTPGPNHLRQNRPPEAQSHPHHSALPAAGGVEKREEAILPYDHLKQSYSVARKADRDDKATILGSSIIHRLEYLAGLPDDPLALSGVLLMSYATMHKRFSNNVDAL